MKNLMILITLLISLTVYGQNTKEKQDIETIQVNIREYKALLIESNKTVDKLHLAQKKVKLLEDRNLLHIANNASIALRLENEKKTTKQLRKEKRRAWWNGIWQGAAIGGAGVTAVLLSQ